jgi:hypothetical protein
MAPRPRYWHVLQAAKREVCTALDFYNSSTGDRNLEGFIVHMGIGWLYLCQAILEKRRVDYRHWDRSGGRRRLVHEDGRPKVWELRRCVRELIPADDDPVRCNVEFFIPIRNVVEHRWTQSLGPVIAGKAQSYVLNFERILVDQFGKHEGLSDCVRLPILLSTFTEDAVEAAKRAFRTLPASVRTYIAAYDSALPQVVRDHPGYEMRLVLLPRTSPKSEADAAVEFVRLEDLTDQQREALSKVTVIIRERQRDVRFLEGHRPSDVVREVAARIPFEFSLYGDHTPAWKHFGVRPDSDAVDRSKTDERYCIYDKVHGDYVYTMAWIEKLARHLADERGFSEVVGKPPRLRRT